MTVTISEISMQQKSNSTLLSIENLFKHFELHNQQQTKIPIFQDFSLSFSAGECSVLVGPSGLGKSTLLKCLYGNYKIESGRVIVHFEDGKVDMASCSPQMIHGLRREVIGYVSQFLRVIPRVPALELVSEPLIAQGHDASEAREKAATMLARLSISERLWNLSPTTFSGGEQQRINIARGFVANYPVLLLDEPTASLDAKNVEVVINLIEESKARGAAIIGIFHDAHIREQVADVTINLAEVVK